MKTKLILLLSLVATTAIEAKSKAVLDDDVPETKGTSLHHYDLAVLATILAIKFKAVLLVLAVIFGIGVYFKLFAGFGGYYKGLKCPPPVFDPHGHHRDWDGGPAIGDHLERAAHYSAYTENMDFEILSNVMKGMGLMERSVNASDIGPCKRRLVCEADRMAHINPALGYTVQMLSNLARYRSSRSTNERPGVCAALYPECRTGMFTYDNYYALNRTRRLPPRKRLLPDGT